MVGAVFARVFNPFKFAESESGLYYLEFFYFGELLLHFFQEGCVARFELFDLEG